MGRASWASAACMCMAVALSAPDGTAAAAEQEARFGLAAWVPHWRAAPAA